MIRRGWKSRLQLLNGGRAHYLEFLRNLTPQVVLASLALLQAVKLNFTRFDIGNSGPTFAFWMLLASALIAAYANTTLFYERCFSALRKWKRKTTARLEARGLRGWRYFLAVLCAIYKRKFLEVLELTFAFALIQVALAIVFALGFFNAMGIWKLAHP